MSEKDSKFEDNSADGNGLTLREAFDQGYRRVCIGCNTVFKPGEVRKEFCDDGHGGRDIEMCKCGSDLIGNIIEEDGELLICRTSEIDESCITGK